MRVLALRFLGLRTESFVQTAMLLRDVMNMPVTRQREDPMGFRLEDGTTVELYGPDEEFHAFFEKGPVVGFVVDDFDAARAAMLEARVQFIGPPQHENGTSWNHFYAPDGTIFEIIGPGAALNEQGEYRA
jgi:catechol 2,3-dioxygenase-like lactoylglutathione lyase family enzyme